MFIILSLVAMVVSLIIAGIAYRMKRVTYKQHAISKRTLKRIHFLEEISTTMFALSAMIIIGWMFLSLPISY